MGSSSGLIIAFGVAVWAVYFVPLVLRRYDEASKNASVESSGSLSRVIARRASAAQEPAPRVVEPVESAQAVKAPHVRTLDRPAARLAAKRRRRTLLTLLAMTAVVASLAAASLVAPLWVAAPVALIVAWLVACRIQVRGELGLAGAKMPRLAMPKAVRSVKAPRLKSPRIKSPKLKSSKVKSPKVATKSGKPVSSGAADEEETIIVSGQFEDINPGRRHQMEDIALEAHALEDQIVIAVPSVSTAGEALWDPLPVTLPTYVIKPRAGRTVRTIDFGQAGAWTSGHIEGEDVELPHRGDDAGDQRRAVGH